MRIISGNFRGRKLNVPAGADVRPTTDRVRSAVFSALGSMWEFDGTRILDLYAGTGAFGFEALSRGAAFAVFVDHDRRCCAEIEGFAGVLGVSDRCAVICGELPKVLTAVRACGGSGEAEKRPFDLVFADPPYAMEVELLEPLAGLSLVKNGSVLVYEERSKQNAAAPSSDGREAPAEIVKEKVYGDTTVRFYEFR